ncbi:MAG: NAD(P)H-dependent oxidoreductase [Candidatus Cloacimonetes bacterium]|nr:NAD(P)H-dependent oxidoreductase [Candidatus Cloacimonadota bacterium]
MEETKESERPLLQVVIASVRDERKGVLVADWFIGEAEKHGGFEVERIDLAEVNLPLFNEPRHPRLRKYEHEHTKAWSRTVDRADAYVFVTPEYDYGIPAPLANALQYLVHEWAYKPLGFCSYGGVSAGTRGVQMTKQIATTVKLVPMFEAVSIPFFTEKIDAESGLFDPGPEQAKAAVMMLDEMLRWEAALRTLRAHKR